MSGWIELRMRVPASVYAALEALLETAGALSVTQGEGDVQVFAEPGVASERAWTSFSVAALFDEGQDLDVLETAIRNLVGREVALERVAIADRPWHQVWKQSWSPQVYAGGLCVCPTWCEPPAEARRVIRLDPGGAFGTGTHETTALCLDWLASGPDLVSQRVIDYGCGSGILAIAASLLGAARVAAVDVDDDALCVARENAALNGVGARLAIGRPDILEVGQADVLIANILLEPLIALAPRFADLLVPGARLALSGLLATQLPRVLEVYGSRFTMAESIVRGEWALVAGRRH